MMGEPDLQANGVLQVGRFVEKDVIVCPRCHLRALLHFSKSLVHIIYLCPNDNCGVRLFEVYER